MFLIGIFLCVVIAVVIGAAMPGKENYGKLDKLGVVLNIVLSVLYVPMSLYGIFSLFAADSMFLYSETIQKIIEFMITIGVSLPFVSVFAITLSVVFRRKGRRISSFLIQFIPLLLFVVMAVTFEVISNIPL